MPEVLSWGFLHLVHDTSYKLMMAHGGYSLDHLWPAHVGFLPPRMNLSYWTYVKYKNGYIAPKLTYPHSPYDILVKASMIVQHKATFVAWKREEEKFSQASPSSFVVPPTFASCPVTTPFTSTPMCLLGSLTMPAWQKGKHEVLDHLVLPTVP